MTEHVWDVYDSEGAVVHVSAASSAAEAVDEALAAAVEPVVLTGVQRRMVGTGEIGPMIHIAHAVATGQGASE